MSNGGIEARQKTPASMGGVIDREMMERFLFSKKAASYAFL